MEKRNKKLLKNTAILSLGTLCTKGIMFLMTPLFTRWISQKDYGIFDLLITYISLISPIISLSCSEAVFRFLLEKKSENRNKKVITNAVVIDLIGFIISLAIILVASLCFPKIKKLLICFLVLLILETLNTLMMMICRGMKKIDIYTISNIIFVFSMVFGVCIFVKIFDLQLYGILLGYIFGYITSILFMSFKFKINKYIVLKYFDKKITMEMLKYSFPLIPNALSWWVVNVSDRTIVSIILGSSTNAILAVANKIPNLCQTFFNVFNISWQESASETINDKDKDKYYSDIMNNMFKVLSSICILILSCNFLFFEILFDNSYYLAYYQVPILIISIIFSMLSQFLGGIYIARKESYKNGKTTLIVAFINIFVHLVLIKFIGIYAATISTFISYFVLFFIRFKDIKKDINIKIDNKSFVITYIFFYFFISCYINYLYLNIINLFIAILYFIYINKNILIKIKKRVIK